MESFLMWLMPISQVASWSLLVWAKMHEKSPFTNVLFPIGTFYWLWAVKNIVQGPLRQDLGVITFLLALMPGLVEIAFPHWFGAVHAMHLLGGFASVVLTLQYGGKAVRHSLKYI
jgi:hypothetical protein